MKKARVLIFGVLGVLCLPGLVMAGNPGYIHFLWNQHQPSYINSQTGKFKHEFTRLHAMSSYYFMAAVLVDGRNDINTYEIQDNQWVDTGQPTGRGFPFAHVTINLSGILLEQIDHYVSNLAPAFDAAQTVDEVDLSKYPGGDPRDTASQDGLTLFETGFDLLCKPAGAWSVYDKRLILDHTIYLKPISSYIEQWPSYKALRDKRIDDGGGNPAHWTDEELSDLLMWYNLAVMHAFFKETDDYVLQGHDPKGQEVTAHITGIKSYGQFKTWGKSEDEWFGAHGETLDVTDMGGYSNGSGTEYPFQGRTCRHFTDRDRLHLALMQYRVLKFIVPIHRKLMNTLSPDGWPHLEVTTTPLSHPILPLVYDTDNYLEQSGWNRERVDAINFQFHGQGQAAPGPYGPDANAVFDDDAYNQVAEGCTLYRRLFGSYPHGMWPGEGSVGESVIYAFRRNGVKWIASGNETCEKSGHHDDTGRMYRIDEDSAFLDGDENDAMSICFRSESDLVGFNGGYYNGGWGVEGDAKASDIMENHVKVDWGHRKFWTHTADGENPWGWFHRLGATFLEQSRLPDGSPSYGLYYRLNRANPMIPSALRWYTESDLFAATPSMYIGIRNGAYSNDGVEPLAQEYELEPLAHGSWIFGNFDTWMGEDNEIQGWIDLKKTRDELDSSGINLARPNPYGPKPSPLTDRKGYFEWLVWRNAYLAESSDYFWWYGNDQCFGSDEIFDDLFRERLVDTYVFARKAGYEVAYPAMQIHPIISPEDNVNNHHPNGAAEDDDYRNDCEPPPGHGELIRVPPLTEAPVVSPGSLPADGRSRALVRIKVWEEGLETSRIKAVTVDLSPIGGSRAMELYDDGDVVLHGDMTGGDGVYSGWITVVEGIAAGPKLLVIHAIDDSDPPGVSFDPIESLDYAAIEVLEGLGNPPQIGVAGYGATRLVKEEEGLLEMLAVLTDPGDDAEAELLYQGLSTGVSFPISQGFGTWNASLLAPTPGLFLLELAAQNGQGSRGVWPYLDVSE